LVSDGCWTFAPDVTAPYRTRVLVRAPAKPAALSGTVVVEWLNVSGGVDANPEWVSTAEEVVRAGDVWVGVSVQRIGVEGRPVITRVEDVPAPRIRAKVSRRWTRPAPARSCIPATAIRSTSTRRSRVRSAPRTLERSEASTVDRGR
jgi:hypothetical protein